MYVHTADLGADWRSRLLPATPFIADQSNHYRPICPVTFTPNPPNPTAYIGVVLLSDLVPGPSALSTPPEVFDELLQESLNLWWINDALTAAGIGIVHTRPCHPVSEALFNFVVAWAMLLVPVMLTDGAAQKVKNKVRCYCCC